VVLTNNGKPSLKPQDATDTMSAAAAFALSSHLHVYTVAKWPAYVTNTSHGVNLVKYQSGDRYVLAGGPSNTFDIHGYTGGSSGGGWTMRLDGAAWGPSNTDRPAVRTAMQAGPRLVRMAFPSLAGAWTQINLGYPISTSHSYELQELVFYNSDQTSNDTGIESDINAYYGIYGDPNPSDPTVTWGDYPDAGAYELYPDLFLNAGFGNVYINLYN